jgi:anti-sigma regulatory factor (Ser/Thr protein kinase)
VSVNADANFVLDARETRSSTLYGLIALLLIGQSRNKQAVILLPKHDQTLAQWAQSRFLIHAATFFDLETQPGNVEPTDSDRLLLPITPIAANADVHTAVSAVQLATSTHFVDRLGLDPSVAMRLTTVISEVCQNIIEHSGGNGWVGSHIAQTDELLSAQHFNLAVGDTGIGFRRSLLTSQIYSTDIRLTDEIALEAAIMLGTSRFADPGRGHGLSGVRRSLRKLGGVLTVRSGTAQILVTPGPTGIEPIVGQLPAFQGAQIEITIPARKSIP